MRFLRYFLYLVLQLGFLGGLFWLYGLIRGTSILEFNFFSSGLLTFLALSIIPYIELLRRQRKLPLARMRDIRSMPFVLRSTFKGRVSGPVGRVKETVRAVRNSAVLTDRVLVLASEDESSLEYVDEQRLEMVDTKRKRKRFETTRVEIRFSASGVPSSTDLEIVSSSDERDVGIDNIANEENVGVIVMGLLQAGILGASAPPIKSTGSHAHTRLEP